jgi:hypothetical protein
MKITDDELLDLIEDITVTLGQILLTHRELTEGLLDDGPTVRSQQKIDDLKKRLEDEKIRLAKSRRFQQRKKELEKIRDDHRKDVQTETASRKTVRIQNQSGRVIGWMQAVGKDRIHVLDQQGRTVGRFIHGKTYDGQGRFIGDGDQALRALGQTLSRLHRH